MDPKELIRTRRRHRAGSLFWAGLSLVFGWSLFAWWWYELLRDDAVGPLFTLLAIIAAFCLLILGVTFGWIGHNRRLARRGRRGVASAYRVPRFERDALGRRITLPEGGRVRRAGVVRVSISGERKVYRAEERPTS